MKESAPDASPSSATAAATSSRVRGCASFWASGSVSFREVAYDYRTTLRKLRGAKRRRAGRAPASARRMAPGGAVQGALGTILGGAAIKSSSSGTRCGGHHRDPVELRQRGLV